MTPYELGFYTFCAITGFLFILKLFKKVSWFVVIMPFIAVFLITLLIVTLGFLLTITA